MRIVLGAWVLAFILSRSLLSTSSVSSSFVFFCHLSSTVILFRPLSPAVMNCHLFSFYLSNYILFRRLSSTFILFRPLSELSSVLMLFRQLLPFFILLNPLSSSLILFHLPSSSFIFLNPHSSTLVMFFILFRPLSSAQKVQRSKRS